MPSTPGQRLLGEALAEEFVNMGLKAKIDEYGYVYGEIQATTGFEHKPVIGLIAHMDTSESASGENIRARIIKAYDGGDIVLNGDKDIVMRPSEFSSLKDNIGKDQIVTDGTTLLGADDKAGVAEIITLAQKLSESHDIPHGKIMLAFTPDEEVGRGTNHFDIAGFNANFAYTVDGGPLGQLEYENFNAASARFIVHGINIHPGEGKNKMKNACLIAGELMSMMPPSETPAATEAMRAFIICHR
jgi:tripeptide aminopeptidase